MIFQLIVQLIVRLIVQLIFHLKICHPVSSVRLFWLHHDYRLSVRLAKGLPSYPAFLIPSDRMLKPFVPTLCRFSFHVSSLTLLFSCSDVNLRLSTLAVEPIGFSLNYGKNCEELRSLFYRKRLDVLAGSLAERWIRPYLLVVNISTIPLNGDHQVKLAAPD